MIRAAVVVPLIVLFATTAQVSSENSPTEKTIAFEGIVERISVDTGVLSGGVAVYRLAKYSVTRICKGRYRGKRIVVDHLILSGKELEGIQVGDRVCVSVQMSNEIFARYNANGIRKPSDKVKIFYIAGKVEESTLESCKCSGDG